MSAAMAAHLSVVTAQSPSLSAARQSVIHLYRDFQRGVSFFNTQKDTSLDSGDLSAATSDSEGVAADIVDKGVGTDGTTQLIAWGRFEAGRDIRNPVWKSCCTSATRLMALSYITGLRRKRHI
jgi:hypothetical protein